MWKFVIFRVILSKRFNIFNGTRETETRKFSDVIFPQSKARIQRIYLIFRLFLLPKQNSQSSDERVCVMVLRRRMIFSRESLLVSKSYLKQQQQGVRWEKRERFESNSGSDDLNINVYNRLLLQIFVRDSSSLARRRLKFVPLNRQILFFVYIQIATWSLLMNPSRI